MKILSIETFEKLQIDPIKIEELPKQKPIDYRYFPRNIDELGEIVDFRLKDEGPETDLNDIDVSKIKDMTNLFNITETNCPDFNADIRYWNVSNVKYFTGMFKNCEKFNCPLNNWDVSNGIQMMNMFLNCKTYNQPMNDWNVSNVMNMGSMFDGCFEFNQPLDSWHDKLNNVIHMDYMFNRCTRYNQDLSSWDINGISSYGMFFHCIIKDENKPIKLKKY